MPVKGSKKVILFIVEGPSDETALSTVLCRIFSTEKTRFFVVYGDVFTQNGIFPNKIVSAVGAQVKKFMDMYHFRPSDIEKVIHLTDTDGAFIPKDAIVEECVEGKEYPHYAESRILTPDPQGIIFRNKIKSENLQRMVATGQIRKIPYRLYYFSCNLDHVLYNQTNLSDEEKRRMAEDFDARYADDAEAFIHFIKDSDFSVGGLYKDSWKFIETDTNSLQRHTNLGLLFDGVPTTQNSENSQTVKTDFCST